LYPDGFKDFDLGKAFGKNITVRMGDCNHRRYLPELIRLVANGTMNPSRILTQRTQFTGVIDAYEQFERRQQGWLKVELVPSKAAPVATKGEVVTA
jgi:threonine dehydrogenase-like Zn-dependent dehydrogenase